LIDTPEKNALTTGHPPKSLRLPAVPFALTGVHKKADPPLMPTTWPKLLMAFAVAFVAICVTTQLPGGAPLCVTARQAAAKCREGSARASLRTSFSVSI